MPDTITDLIKSFVKRLQHCVYILSWVGYTSLVLLCSFCFNCVTVLFLIHFSCPMTPALVTTLNRWQKSKCCFFCLLKGASPLRSRHPKVSTYQNTDLVKGFQECALKCNRSVPLRWSDASELEMHTVLVLHHIRFEMSSFALLSCDLMLVVHACLRHSGTITVELL